MKMLAESKRKNRCTWNLMVGAAGILADAGTLAVGGKGDDIGDVVSPRWHYFGISCERTSLIAQMLSTTIRVSTTRSVLLAIGSNHLHCTKQPDVGVRESERLSEPR